MERKAEYFAVEYIRGLFLLLASFCHLKVDLEGVLEDLLVFVFWPVLLDVCYHRHLELDLACQVLDGGQEPSLLRDKFPRVLQPKKKGQEGLALSKHWTQNLHAGVLG